MSKLVISLMFGVLSGPVVGTYLFDTGAQYPHADLHTFMALMFSTCVVLLLFTNQQETAADAETRTISITRPTCITLTIVMLTQLIAYMTDQVLVFNIHRRHIDTKTSSKYLLISNAIAFVVAIAIQNAAWVSRGRTLIAIVLSMCVVNLILIWFPSVLLQPITSFGLMAWRGMTYGVYVISTSAYFGKKARNPSAQTLFQIGSGAAAMSAPIIIGSMWTVLPNYVGFIVAAFSLFTACMFVIVMRGEASHVYDII